MTERGRGIHLDDETRETISSLYENGKSRLEIQIELKVSQPTIRKVLTAAGYPPREMRQPTIITDEIRQHVVELRNRGRGMGATLISRELGIAKRTVLNILKEELEGLKSYTQSDISPEMFIATWQQNETADAVARELGISVRGVLTRAFKYRQRGVPLKRYASARRHDWDSLKEFAGLFLDENEGE